MSSDSPGIRPGPLRNLPSIDMLMRDEHVKKLIPSVGAEQITAMAREQVAGLRDEISGRADGGNEPSAAQLYAESIRRILTCVELRSHRMTRRVINATGVVLHTNLGRSPLSPAARSAVAVNAFGYCSVEYDPRTGERTSRGRFAEELLTQLTKAESSLIVNNCAAATFLALSVFAAGGEAIISRGELVEIGGDFRIPDVLVQSGASLREVGTTNRTSIVDYEKAITPDTRMLLRIHPSNYKIVGFTDSVDNRELAKLAHKHDLVMFEDAGSGALLDVRTMGLEGEPVIATSIGDGADIVAFSGDKLLGGPQCGIIVGKRELIEQLRRHPLYRALRVSKLIYSALEATLLSYSRGTAIQDIPTLRMLSASYDDLAARCAAMIERCHSGALRLQIIDGESVGGGGCLPAQHLTSPLIALDHDTLSAATIEAMLRQCEPPVISRIEHGRVLIDLRTVSGEEEAELAAAISHCGSQNPA